MWSWKIVGCILLGTGFTSEGLKGQGGKPIHGLAMTFLESQLAPISNPLHFKSLFELEYAFSLNGLMTSNSPNSNQLGLTQNLKVRSVYVKGERLSLTNVLVHTLGIRYIFDSIMEVNQDDNTITTRIDLKIKPWLNLSVNSVLTSRIFKSYDLLQDDTLPVRILKGGLLTPLVWNFSFGLGFTSTSLGSLNVGLTGGKLTYVREKEVFLQRSATSFYGVDKGHDYTLEYGMTLHYTVDRDLVKFLHWNCDLLLFKNYHETPDLTLKNYLGFRINKYFQTKISTKILYEENLSKHIQVENLISVGFYLKL